MTRKDFIIIAGTIRNTKMDTSTRIQLADNIANALRETNPNFDRARFIDVCMWREEQ